jgi:hypothetical protein
MRPADRRMQDNFIIAKRYFNNAFNCSGIAANTIPASAGSRNLPVDVGLDVTAEVRDIRPTATRIGGQATPEQQTAELRLV